MATNINITYWKRYLSPRLLIASIRKKGFFWSLMRSFGIIRSAAGTHARPVISKVWNISDTACYKGRKDPKVLYAFYDLAVSPPTFDIVKFIVLAEIERRSSGCESIHISIVSDITKDLYQRHIDEYRNTGAVGYNAESILWRIKNILIPCCWLMPSCRQVSIFTSLEQARAFQSSLASHVFPKGYTVRFPTEGYGSRRFNAAALQVKELPSLCATAQARDFVSSWIRSRAGQRKAVTVTLRESAYESTRNSNIDAWAEFSKGLDQSAYCPIIIRDAEAHFESLPAELKGLLTFSEACLNVELRMALYELSYLNMFVNNGPLALCMRNSQTRYLAFKMITSSGASREEHFYSTGLKPGSQPSYAAAFQRLVWEDDNLEVISREFRQMCEKIEKNKVNKKNENVFAKDLALD